MTSEWNVVEHKDILALNIHISGFGDHVSSSLRGKFIHLKVEKETKENAARFGHMDGMKNFHFEMNPDFLDLGVKDDRTVKMADGTLRLFISKLKSEGMKENTAKPKAEESKGFIRTVSTTKLTPEEDRKLFERISDFTTPGEFNKN
ncbi:hypothetical protein MKW92_029156 [Papaver armeniacum]|nr:hypothetical protein MKW92_029156 [Papaver armeniacum]